jgi:hypothetical protein
MIVHYENVDHDIPEVIHQTDPESLITPEAWDLTDFEDIVPQGCEQ